MYLYFLRHGKAEERSDSSRDFDRKLTFEGIAEMKDVALGFARLVGSVDMIFSSPLPRASQTAEIVAEAISAPAGALRTDDRLASGALGLGELQSLLHGLPADCRVIVVGHEPDLSTVVGRLTGAAIELKKAGLAFVEVSAVEPDRGVLRWLLTARHLQSARQSA
jgi:phosphohistidine phosphatase